MNEPLAYDPSLTETAQKLRRNTTPAEKRIWFELLNNRKLKGYKFTRQKPIHYYILDFYCAELMLGIEIDGKIHEELVEHDAERTVELESFGIKIIRYTNDEVMSKLEEVRSDLLRQVEIREKELKI